MRKARDPEDRICRGFTALQVGENRMSAETWSANSIVIGQYAMPYRS